MSISSEITNLAENRDAIKAAIIGKRPAILPGSGLSSFPAAIQSIPDGDEPVAPVWAPPDEWPNLRTLIEEDQEGFEYKVYYLFDSSLFPSVPNIMSSFVTMATKAITSDGSTYTSNATHTWNESSSYGRYRWVAWYSNSNFGKIQFGRSYQYSDVVILWIVGNKPVVGNNDSYTIPALKGEYPYYLQSIEFPSVTLNDRSNNYGLNRMFFSAESLQNVPSVIDSTGATKAGSMFGGCRYLPSVPKVIDISEATDTNSMFANCWSLLSVPDVLDTSKSLNTSYMFSNCRKLRKVPSAMDLSSATNTSYMFLDCWSLISVPETLDMSSATNTSSMFSGCHSLERAPSQIDLSNSTNVSSMFYFCDNLMSVPSSLDISKATNASSMFNGCRKIKSAPVFSLSTPSVLASANNMFSECESMESFDQEFDFSACTTVSAFFANCISLTRVPDKIDLSSVSNAPSQNNMFQSCFGLTALPTHVTSKWSLSFSWSRNIRDKSSVATFDDDESPTSVNGGFIGNLNQCPNTGQTITLNSYIRGLFTSSQQTVIASTMSTKGWGLAW